MSGAESQLRVILGPGCQIGIAIDFRSVSESGRENQIMLPATQVPLQTGEHRSIRSARGRGCVNQDRPKSTAEIDGVSAVADCHPQSHISRGSRSAA